MKRSLISAPPLLLAVATTGCGADAADPNGDSHAVTVTFRAQVGSQPADCSTPYDGLGRSGSSARLADARLFVSELEIRGLNGEWLPVELGNSLWQNGGVALLDFEDGTGACADSGTAETNLSVSGTSTTNEYDAVRYRVGVPFELNHLDNASARPPLNSPGMFWAWQGGYKFLRVDWEVEGGVVPRWNIHLGSTGCKSSAPTEAPQEPCARANSARVEVELPDPASEVVIDLSRLVESAELTDNASGSPPGCMSAPMEADDCSPVFSALGMAFDDGKCVDDCAAQTTFIVNTPN